MPVRASGLIIPDTRTPRFPRPFHVLSRVWHSLHTLLSRADVCRLLERHFDEFRHPCSSRHRHLPCPIGRGSFSGWFRRRADRQAGGCDEGWALTRVARVSTRRFEERPWASRSGSTFQKAQVGANELALCGRGRLEIGSDAEAVARLEGASEGVRRPVPRLPRSAKNPMTRDPCRSDHVGAGRTFQGPADPWRSSIPVVIPGEGRHLKRQRRLAGSQVS
jgi:hypothetical protein